MPDPIKFAMRNILRNKKRTLLTAFSIFTASVIVTFGIGFFNGICNGVMNNYVDYSTGNLKVTTALYAKYERFLPVYEYIENSGVLVSNLSSIPGVSSVEERVRFGIIIGRGEKSEPATGIGIDLLSRKFNLEKKLTGGKLEDEGLYVCSGLAEKLNIKTGDEILLAASTAERGLNGIKLRIKGIICTGMSMFDKHAFFIDLQNTRKLLKMKNGITEIFIFTDKNSGLAGLKEKINKILPPGLVLRDPDQQTGGLYSIFESLNYAMYFILLLMLMLASFVIVNTMVMAVYERMKEIGTLKALGMTDRGIFLNFTLEGAIIGCIGGISGGLSGYLLVIYSSIKGLNFSAMLKNRDIPIGIIIYPWAGADVLFAAVGMAIVITVISSAIPAWQARKLLPAEALRYH